MHLIAWEALALESGIIASNLSNKNFLPKEEWLDYQIIANQLTERFERLSKKTFASLNLSGIKQLRTQCYTALRTIHVRLNYFDPKQKTAIKSKFYETQIEYLRFRLGELKKRLDQGFNVDPKHNNLFTPHNKMYLIQSEVDTLEAQIADIERKRAALY